MGIEAKAIMFKATTITNQTQRILVLEGILVAPWPSNLKGKWDEERRTHEGATFVVDLTKLRSSVSTERIFCFRCSPTERAWWAIAFSLEL
jgi:hypothetical protein